MASEKLVRCEIERADGSGCGIRFVPLDVFGLWEHLMASRHGLRVRSRAASVWVEIEESSPAGAVRPPVERVTEITLFVFDAGDGMLHRVCRYAPTPEAALVRQVLVTHYAQPDGGAGPAPWLRERQGVWFRPRAESGPLSQEGDPITVR